MGLTTDQGWLLIILGLVAGFTSGLIGIGGGLIIVPVLVFFFGFSQHLAQGTTLALMVPPIGLLAAWTYYRQGAVDVRAAVVICGGFILGSWLGAKVAVQVPNDVLRRVFGGAMMAIAVKMILGK